MSGVSITILFSLPLKNHSATIFNYLTGSKARSSFSKSKLFKMDFTSTTHGNRKLADGGFLYVLVFGKRILRMVSSLGNAKNGGENRVKRK